MKLRFPFQRTRSTTLLRASAVMTLAAIALMAWALVDPTPLPVMLAMTGGQALGTTALALYVFVIVRDLRRDRSRARRDSLGPHAGERASRDSLAPLSVGERAGRDSLDPIPRPARGKSKSEGTG